LLLERQQQRIAVIRQYTSKESGAIDPSGRLFPFFY
jgi:hypothetical protein